MRARFTAACTGFFALALASGALGWAQTHVAARDSFRGRIASATHHFASDNGRVTIELAVGRPDRSPRQLTVTLHGIPCRGARHCLGLSGKLKGTLTDRGSVVPDVGRAFTVRGSGSVQPLGHVSASGSVRGTGFIARGQESLQLKLATHDSTISLTAHSELVPGFTGP